MLEGIVMVVYGRQWTKNPTKRRQKCSVGSCDRNFTTLDGK